MTNPLTAGRRTELLSFRSHPLDLDGYCAWLNAHEKRRGVWVIVERHGERELDFKQDSASDEWLRERGLAPKIGSAA